MNLVVALACLGRVGAPFLPTDFIGYPTEGYAFGNRVGRDAPPAADPSQATGRVKRRDNQIHRARVLEVRIHLPPAVSLANFRIAPLARPQLRRFRPFAGRAEPTESALPLCATLGVRFCSRRISDDPRDSR